MVKSLSVFIVSIVLSLNASAHGGASGIVKQRMDAMTEIKDASKAIREMARAERAMDFEQAQKLARSVIDHAANMTSLFPDTKASRHGAKTEALPEIWQQWDKFSASADELEQAATKALQAAQAEDRDSLNGAIRDMGRTCKSCHKQFRKAK